MMSAEVLTPASASVVTFGPSAAELRAIAIFASTDTTRPSLHRVWQYAGEQGHTSMATDGATIVVRRAGDHVGRSLADIAALPCNSEDGIEPPNWARVVTAPNIAGGNEAVRSVNPAYFARVATVEAVASRVAKSACDVAGLSQSRAKHRRDRAALATFSRWVIGGSLDGWYWYIEPAGPGGVRWEGVIMPRRFWGAAQ